MEEEEERHGEVCNYLSKRRRCTDNEKQICSSSVLKTICESLMFFLLPLFKNLLQ